MEFQKFQNFVIITVVTSNYKFTALSKTQNRLKNSIQKYKSVSDSTRRKYD